MIISVECCVVRPCWFLAGTSYARKWIVWSHGVTDASHESVPVIDVPFALGLNVIPLPSSPVSISTLSRDSLERRATSALDAVPLVAL